MSGINDAVVMGCSQNYSSNVLISIVIAKSENSI